MNAQLLNPFAHDTPDSVDSTLEHANASCIQFNNSFSNNNSLFSGHYLAAGRTDGLVNIWDIETKGILSWLEGHVKAITSVCWSQYSRYLASSSLDWNVIIWDLSKRPAVRDRTLRFDAPVRSVNFCPTNSKILAVVLESQQLYLIDLRKRKRVLTKVSSSSNHAESSSQAQAKAQAGGLTEAEEEKEKTRGPRRWILRPDVYFNRESEAEMEGGKDAKALAAAIGGTTCSKFSPDGSLIFAGTTKGSILVFDANTRKVINQVKPQGASGIREMAFDRSGRNLVINFTDRTIRILSVEVLRHASSDPQGTDAEEMIQVNIGTLHKFQDLVNRSPWLGLGFSGDGEYVFGGASHIAAHNIYIWDRGAGALDKILEGPREPLIDVDWHPSRPLLASVSTSGNINIWFTPTKENWSAYAPGFEELEENVEYEEREDEFDLEDEEELARRAQDEEEALVDIWSLGPAAGTTLPSYLMVSENDPSVPANGNSGVNSPQVGGSNLEAGESTNTGIEMKDSTNGIDGEDNVGGTESGWVWKWEYEKEDDNDPSFIIHPKLEDEIPELNSDDGN